MDRRSTPYASRQRVSSLIRARGVALITVLLFFAFLAAIAVRLSVNHSLLIAQSHNAFASDLGLSYALGGEDMARQVLYEDFTQSGKDSDHLQEIWARALPPLSLDEGGQIEVQIRDLNGCFNLNALGSETPAPIKGFVVNLITGLGLGPEIADRISDWIDADDVATGFGAEDSEYLLADPAYRTPNTAMGDVSELRLLHGQDEDPTRLLSRYTCVLPITSLSLNINTVDGDVLASLIAQPDLPRYRAFAIGGRNFRTVADFLQTNPEFAPFSAYLAVVSEYFRIDTQVQIDETVTIMSSVARRDPTTGKVSILSRDFGRDFRSRVQIKLDDDVEAQTAGGQGV